MLFKLVFAVTTLVGLVTNVVVVFVVVAAAVVVEDDNDNGDNGPNRPTASLCRREKQQKEDLGTEIMFNCFLSDCKKQETTQLTRWDPGSVKFSVTHLRAFCRNILSKRFGNHQCD